MLNRMRAVACGFLLASGSAAAELELADYDLAAGREVYDTACMTCHESGMAGAPKVGDPEAWSERIDQGMEVLVRRSLEGYRGESGFMPPRGGYSSLTDEEVANAVAYMVSESQ